MKSQNKMNELIQEFLNEIIKKTLTRKIAG